MDRQSVCAQQLTQAVSWENGSMYFENNKDLMAAQDFAAALKLGCFDQSFMYFGTAYLDDQGVNYRISAKEDHLQLFVRQSASQGIYPTPIMRHIKRCPVPSGHEDAIGLAVKKETARAIRQRYQQDYFIALAQLSNLTPNDGAYTLLSSWQEDLEGVYDAEELQLFGHGVQMAVNSKVLGAAHDLAFKGWLKAQYRQLENEPIIKGHYKKVLSGFAYEDQRGQLRYFYDAKKEVAYAEQASYVDQGVFSTPVYTKTLWLKEMSDFPVARTAFANEMKAHFEQGYLERLRDIKALPSAISSSLFQELCLRVKETCSDEAYRTFLSYGYRWNLG